MSRRASLSTVGGERGSGAGTRRTLLLSVVGSQGDGGVVLDKDLYDEGAIAVAAPDRLEKAGLADAVGRDWTNARLQPTHLFS